MRLFSMIPEVDTWEHAQLELFNTKSEALGKLWMLVNKTIFEAGRFEEPQITLPAPSGS